MENFPLIFQGLPIPLAMGSLTPAYMRLRNLGSFELFVSDMDS